MFYNFYISVLILTYIIFIVYNIIRKTKINFNLDVKDNHLQWNFLNMKKSYLICIIILYVLYIGSIIVNKFLNYDEKDNKYYYYILIIFFILQFILFITSFYLYNKYNYFGSLFCFYTNIFSFVIIIISIYKNYF